MHTGVDKVKNRIPQDNLQKKIVFKNAINPTIGPALATFHNIMDPLPSFFGISI